MIEKDMITLHEYILCTLTLMLMNRIETVILLSTMDPYFTAAHSRQCILGYSLQFPVKEPLGTQNEVAPNILDLDLSLVILDLSVKMSNAR